MQATWLAGMACAYASQPDLPLDRPFTLQNRFPASLEWRYGQIITGAAPLRFAFPSPCAETARSDSSCAPVPSTHLSYAAGADRLGGVAMAGTEFRFDESWTEAHEAGLIITGAKSDLSFYLDSRIFMEMRESGARSSYDREDVDFQDEEATGSLSYASYARFRGSLNWDTRVGRFSARRDAAHWGPGQYSNLVFQQEAVPFYGFSYHASLGPVSITSLYGDLLIGRSQGGPSENRSSRSLYAHRYELALGRSFLVGVSEQLILHGQNKPYLFTPIFPLFIAKTTFHEESNNGNLAVDFTWRKAGLGMLYTEFLLDDLESPSSLLLRDYSQNKWAWMAGAQAFKAMGKGSAGLVAEYSRVEPWVYTHFTAATAQTANMGYPLGNPWGPDAQTVVAKVYVRHPDQGYASIKGIAAWKGRDAGSSLEDLAPRDPRAPKTFLSGEEGPEISAEIFLQRDWKPWSLALRGQVGAEASFSAHLSFWY